MKWENLGRSNNVEDRRGGGGKIVGGGIAGIVIIILALLFGNGDKSQLVGQLINQVQENRTGATHQVITAQDSINGEMVRAILHETESTWSAVFAENKMKYRNPKLVLFSSTTQSGCGTADAGMGPFYCPADETVYIDLSFFEELKQKYGANGGDFATAYVIAHEVGHHVQNLLGTSGKVSALRNQLSEKEYNKYSVALELQADCYAGIWAHDTDARTHFLENGDIENALSAASAVGDDHLQKQAQGYVVPDAFTHGTSAQRVFWFKRGYTTGDIKQANTFEELKD